ncbi:MAG TPA: hypothetical protein PKA63_05010 [Oligoflexia bacterium]|nr:hypothetical protein [Oligoflexia bacterium]HMP48009.1 hypothetical protein [Oligoflexia bacterium]
MHFVAIFLLNTLIIFYPKFIHAESGKNDAFEEIPISIPEPMVFDLVRGLDSRKGELEVNVLSLVRKRDGRLGTEWAPEIEYAVSDGLAFELELPFENERVESVKLASQYTFGYGEAYIHGAQLLLLGDIERTQVNPVLLYLLGIRINEDISALFMSGIGLGPDSFPNIDEEGSSGLDFINNINLFYEFCERLTFGLEVNTLKPQRGRSEVLLMPQVKIHFTENIIIQFGSGSRITKGVSNFEAGSRVIFEF